jgi:hypothetical protein
MILHRWINRRRVRRLAAGERLSKAPLDALFLHLRTCSDCRRDYDLTMGAERLLQTGGASASLPNAAQVELFSSRVIPQAPPVARPMPWLVPALAGACAILLAVILFARHEAPDDFAVRAGQSAKFTVRVFCDRRAEAPIPLDRAPGGRCPDGALYRFAYTAERACAAEIVQVLRDKSRRRVWPEEQAAREVPATTALRPLGATLSVTNDTAAFVVSCKSGESVDEVTISIP